MANKRNCKMTAFDKAINKILDDYADDVTEQTKKAVKAVARQAQREVKEESPVRTGKYKKGWAVNENVSRLGSEAIIFNRSRYQLTHLLEKGHALRNGGRSKPIEHIAPAQERAVDNLMKAVEKIAGD